MRFLKTGLAAGFFAALLALSGCKEAPEPAAPAQGAVETVVPAALQSNVSGAYTTSGTAAARERVAIASRVTAYLRALPAREGARVSKGDSVARLDVTDVRAGIEVPRRRLRPPEPPSAMRRSTCASSVRFTRTASSPTTSGAR